MKDWPFHVYPPLFGVNPIWQQQGGMSAGVTDDGRIVRVPSPGVAETQKLATFSAPNGAGYTNVPTLYGGMPVSDQTAMETARGGYDPDTGKGFQSFGSIEDAERSAIGRSGDRNWELLMRFPWLFGSR